MSAVKITADLSAFRASLRKVLAATKKEEAFIVNNALKDVALRASGFTKKTTPTKIKRDLRRGKLVIKMAVIALNRKGGKWTKEQLKEKVEQIIAARTRGSGLALRSGWFPAAEALGFKIRGARPLPARTASKGGAKKATVSNLSGAITNTVKIYSHGGKLTSVENIPIAVEALNKAVAFVTKDRNDYAQRKIDALLKTHSD